MYTGALAKVSPIIKTKAVNNVSTQDRSHLESSGFYRGYNKSISLSVKGVVLLLIFLQGCATTGLNQQIADYQRQAETIRFFEVLDRMVDDADVRDAASFVVSGFPYLRTNRFLTGLKQDLDSKVRKKQWILWLQQLDIEARRKEIRNLSSRAIGELALELGEKPDRQILQDRVAEYSVQMLNHDKQQPSAK